MRHLGKVLALGGLILAAWLFLRDNPEAILRLLEIAGPGLVLASLVHLFPMALNAQAWRLLFPIGSRPALASLMRVVWIREAVNSLLPVARVGGEIVAYRMLRRAGVERSPAIAGLTVEVALSIVSQLAFALMGLAFLYLDSATTLLARVALAILLLAIGVGLLIALQNAGLTERAMQLLNRLAAGRFEAAIGHSAQIDRDVRALYRRHAAIAGCLLWLLAGWLAGAAEIWAALWALGQPIGIVDAIIVESVIQAVSSAAFLVPGALGVQEAAFLLIGSAIGLDPVTAMALATARRIRDGVVLLPGLISWQLAESRALRSGPQPCTALPTATAPSGPTEP
jgi:putative membrane protein